jgi:hypothetical protein
MHPPASLRLGSYSVVDSLRIGLPLPTQHALFATPLTNRSQPNERHSSVSQAAEYCATPGVGTLNSALEHTGSKDTTPM